MRTATGPLVPAPAQGRVGGLRKRYSSSSSQQAGVHRRPPRPNRQLALGLLRHAALQVRQYLRNELRLLDAGDDLELPTTARTALDLHTEHSLQPSCPTHRHMPWRRGLGRISARHPTASAHPGPDAQASPPPDTDCAGPIRRDTASSASAASAPAPQVEPSDPAAPAQCAWCHPDSPRIRSWHTRDEGIHQSPRMQYRPTTAMSKNKARSVTDCARSDATVCSVRDGPSPRRDCLPAGDLRGYTGSAGGRRLQPRTVA
jgi:hypothetical protein